MAHEARVLHCRGYMLGDTRRPRMYSRTSSISSRPARWSSCSPIAGGAGKLGRNRQALQYQIGPGQNYLPSSRRRTVTPRRFLVQEAERGLERLFEVLSRSGREKQRRPVRRAPRRPRRKTIIQMGFPGYFLIVADFINWGKKNGVPVGPGVRAPARWSPFHSASPTSTRSLRPAVRALPQPERVSMPDFDIDFCQDNRGA